MTETIRTINLIRNSVKSISIKIGGFFQLHTLGYFDPSLLSVWDSSLLTNMDIQTFFDPSLLSIWDSSLMMNMDGQTLK